MGGIGAICVHTVTHRTILCLYKVNDRIIAGVALTFETIGFNNGEVFRFVEFIAVGGNKTIIFRRKFIIVMLMS